MLEDQRRYNYYKEIQFTKTQEESKSQHYNYEVTQNEQRDSKHKDGKKNGDKMTTKRDKTKAREKVIVVVFHLSVWVSCL